MFYPGLHSYLFLTFWSGFHPKDRSGLAPYLFAKSPDLPAGTAYDYEDVLKVARAVFSRSSFFPFQHRDQWDEYPRTRSSERSFGRWFGRDEPDPRETERSRCHVERDRECPALKYRSRDSYDRRQIDAPRARTPRVETRMIPSNGPTREEEDQELVDMIVQIHGLNVREKAYAVLYTRCMDRFPDIADRLPKPEIVESTSSLSDTYSYHTSAPPPPATQPCPRTSDLVPAPSHLASTPWTTYIHSRPRPKCCAFCHRLGHGVRQCRTAMGYVSTGRAVIVSTFRMANRFQTTAPDGDCRAASMPGSRRGLLPPCRSTPNIFATRRDTAAVA